MSCELWKFFEKEIKTEKFVYLIIRVDELEKNKKLENKSQLSTFIKFVSKKFI